jgi:hypothetical protein
VRPSTAGIEGRGEGRGHGAARPSVMLGNASSRKDVKYDVQTLMAPGVKKCVETVKPAAGWSVELAVETTLDEVVDVIPGGKASPMRDCVVEVAWAIRLGPEFRGLTRRTFAAELR